MCHNAYSRRFKQYLTFYRQNANKSKVTLHGSPNFAKTKTTFLVSGWLEWHTHDVFESQVFRGRLCHFKLRSFIVLATSPNSRPLLYYKRLREFRGVFCFTALEIMHCLTAFLVGLLWGVRRCVLMSISKFVRFCVLKNFFNSDGNQVWNSDRLHSN